MKKVFYILGIIALMFATLLILMKVNTAEANPPVFSQTNTTGGTNAATTSLVFIRGGLATSTVITDTAQFNGVGEIAGGMYLLMDIQFTGSSTPAILQWKNEYSNGSNCITATSSCSWYPETNPIEPSLTVASTTNYLNPKINALAFATSTVGGLPYQGSASSLNFATSSASVTVPIRARFVRTVFFTAPGSANVALWAEVLGLRPKY